MGFPFVHLILSWAPAKLYESFTKKELSRAAWATLFLGALFPDFDFIIDVLFNTEIHHTFTHSIIAVIIGFVAVTLFFRFSKTHASSARFLGFIFALGMLTHIIVDAFSPKGIPIFWPLPITYSFLEGIQPVPLTRVTLFDKNLAGTLHLFKSLLLDSAAGILWLTYLYARDKIHKL